MITADPLKKLQFETLIERSRGQLLAALSSMLDSSDLEEVVQEASLKVYLNLDSIEVDAIKAYWYRTARNLAISRLRHQKVVRHFAPDITEALLEQQAQGDADRVYYDAWSRNVLVDAINRLPPVCRNVFIFRQIEGYSKKEIAEKMNISIHTVDNHLTHGMKLCRRHLKETLGFGNTSLETLLKQA
jgi:RNA polymerase sigma-70 factor (ECF subfamily)